MPGTPENPDFTHKPVPDSENEVGGDNEAPEGGETFSIPPESALNEIQTVSTPEVAALDEEQKQEAREEVKEAYSEESQANGASERSVNYAEEREANDGAAETPLDERTAQEHKGRKLATQENRKLGADYLALLREGKIPTPAEIVGAAAPTGKETAPATRAEQEAEGQLHATQMNRELARQYRKLYREGKIPSPAEIKAGAQVGPVAEQVSVPTAEGENKERARHTRRLGGDAVPEASGEAATQGTVEQAAALTPEQKAEQENTEAFLKRAEQEGKRFEAGGRLHNLSEGQRAEVQGVAQELERKRRSGELGESPEATMAEIADKVVEGKWGEKLKNWQEKKANAREKLRKAGASLKFLLALGSFLLAAAFVIAFTGVAFTTKLLGTEAKNVAK